MYPYNNPLYEQVMREEEENKIAEEKDKMEK